MRKRKQDQPEEFANRPFEGLGDLIRSGGIDLARVRKHRKKKDQQTDNEIFREAMRNVREIEEFTRIEVERKEPVIERKQKAPDGLNELREITNGTAPIRLKDTQEYVEWKNPAYKQNITDMLHDGEIAVQDYVDLHGYTLGEAAEEIDRFIRNALRQGFCCVKIIHGRGLGSPNGPVLKNAVVRSLSSRYRKHVMAFTSARQCDGGLGALYVLLRCRIG